LNSEGALIYGEWDNLLASDDPKRDFILDGIKNGFNITTTSYTGHDVWECNYKSATNIARRLKVEQQIIEELRNGRYIITDTKPKIISALGAVDKSDSGKIRLIHDCSRPPGSAVNDYAINEKFSYSSMQDAAALVTPGCYLAKVDLSNAYRSVKIHPSNFEISGLAWTFSGDNKPTIMYDTRLMFGARKSPSIFNELSQAVCRIMKSKGVSRIIAYLDDFLIISDTFEECQRNMQHLLQTLRALGFAINYSKIRGPSQRLTFLGVELDTINYTLRLPDAKLSKFMDEINIMYKRKTASKKELQSLAGRLSWASQIVVGG
jgi:hypothetical protein